LKFARKIPRTVALEGSLRPAGGGFEPASGKRTGASADSHIVVALPAAPYIDAAAMSRVVVSISDDTRTSDDRVGCRHTLC
jgi:hypothetical protein